MALILKWVGHAFRVPLSGLAYLAFGLGGAFLGVVIMPFLHLFPGTLQQKRRRCQWVTGWGFRVFHWYLNLIGVMTYWPVAKGLKQRFETTLEQARARGGPASMVVTANHPSLVDTTAIMASYPYLVCVVKAKVARFPLLWPLMKFCGHVSAPDDFGGATAVAEELIKRLENGDSVLLFPESTRSPDSGMRRFRRGPFEIAKRAQTSVQPVAIRSSPGLLKGGLGWYQLPKKKCHYSLEALAPFPPADSPPTGPSLGERCRTQIQEALSREFRDT